jgi:phosphoglycerol transferase
MLNKNQETSLYAENYVDPRSVEVSDDGEHRNLIYIYLESMERTYADVESGGAQEVNYIPNLTALAQENISFSDTDGLGGFVATDGAGWTMGAIFSTTSGIPFEFPVGNNDMDQQELFASGLYNLGDFLEDEGYNQEFLCGSKASFAGRKKYMKQHGNYKIFDLGTARKKGYIPEDYYVWWGFEDYRLYDIAKDEITRLAKKDEPFNFTMLTVDTHHIGGYVCELCPTDYEEQTANVIACADRQIGDFIDWLKEQDFYENTTIVITGDHPRMDNYLVDGVAYNDRTVYNCFINSVYDEEPATTERQFTAMDIFPTVLSAMGYQIEGEHLGLGVNLYSGEETLVEKMGIDALNDELMKSSRFYVESFAPELLSLVEDEFDSLCSICFYGSEYNVDEFVTEGAAAPQGIASWIIGDRFGIAAPVEHKDGKVTVRVHVQEVYNSSQSYTALQDDAVIAQGTVTGTQVLEFQADVKDGVCSFTLELPDAVSPNDLDPADADTNKLSLLIKSITINDD